MISTPAPALVRVDALVKEHGALRPLRMRALTVADGDIVAIAGIDAGAAEVFVNLVTGATLPDTGDVSLFGQNTRAMANGQAWLKSLEGLAMVSGRAVLIESFSALQNITMPFTLEVDPIDPRYMAQAVGLAKEVGLDPAHVHVPAGKLTPGALMRTHVARALALDPRLLIAEHPTATLPRDAVTSLADDLARVVRARGIALLVLTADEPFAKALGGRRLALNAATGELREPGLLQKLFGN